VFASAISLWQRKLPTGFATSNNTASNYGQIFDADNSADPWLLYTVIKEDIFLV